MADQPTEPITRPPISAEIAGNRLELIESGEARLRMLIEHIACAQRCIKMLMYMFNPDHVGHAVRDALVDAAKRGVEVRLLIDGFGSDAPADYFNVLNQAGGEECVFNPSYGRRYLLRNHQKLIVIDDEIAIIGGANIDDTYMTDRGAKHWRDLWLRLEGPEVAVPSQYFDTLFRWASSKRRRPRLQYARRRLAE
jgi:cardiolipin synthase